MTAVKQGRRTVQAVAAVWGESSSPIFSSWLKRLMRGYRLRWCSSSAALAALMASSTPPEVLLVHLERVSDDDLGRLREMSMAEPGTKLVALGVRPQQCPLSFRLGACGFILIGEVPERARVRLYSALRGEMTLCERAVAALQLQFATHRVDVDTVVRTLSVREREALGWLCQGEPLTRVARRMGVSYHTATTFVRRMYEKVGVNSRVALTRFGYQAGLGKQRRPKSGTPRDRPGRNP